jgi:hypothetical protein
MRAVCFLCLVLLLGAAWDCYSSTPAIYRVSGLQLDELSLIQDAVNFARDEAAQGNEAWVRIQSYPRDQLVGTLVVVRGKLTTTDSRRVDIAFVFCYLDEQYAQNRQIIVSCFNSKGKPCDSSLFSLERMLARLVKRGDKELLLPLFRASWWADGALAEALADTFADELSHDSKDFLAKLKRTPYHTRKRVYELLNDNCLSQADARKVLNDLRSLPKGSPLRQVANELASRLLAVFGNQ